MLMLLMPTTPTMLMLLMPTTRTMLLLPMAMMGLCIVRIRAAAAEARGVQRGHAIQQC